MGKITSYKDFKNNVQSIRDELTKQGYTPRSVPSEQKEETKNTKKIEKGKGLFKKTGKSSFNDIPKIQELQNEYQKAKDWGFYDYTIDQIKKEELPTKFGNVNMNKRPLIRWNDELKKKYENELKSWGYDPEIGGIDTVFGGSDKFGTDINNSGWNVAYTPIMPDGTFLDKGTVDNYMNSLVKEAYEKNGNVTNEELETLDKKGMQVGDKYVHGIFAGVDGDEKDYHKPYSAEDRGKLMHFSGKYGAINIAKRGTDNLKTNPNEEQSDSDEREEYLNQQVDIPITDNKSISLKYRTVKTIDNFLKRNKEKNKYKKAQQLDEMIDKLDLSENELKNAKSYAGLKKLSLMSSSNGKDSVEKEITQPIANFFKGAYDSADSTIRTFVKDGFPFKASKLGGGEYSQQLQEIDKYYTENPDELGNDFFSKTSDTSGAKGDYFAKLNLDKWMERYNDTNPITHAIGEWGFRSAGEMAGAAATAEMTGLNDLTSGVGRAIGMTAKGTKVGQAISKVANATPDIANVAEKGIGSKIANAAINKANTLSIGSAAKFLNPLDNSTTLLMGIDSAQQKYDNLVKNGYDKDTAYKNAMFTGYVNTITEKMGYDGTRESMMFALSPTGSTKKNVGKVLKQYMKANVGEGLEEVYATLFERMGDVVSKVGYVDENGKIQQRKLVGKEGVIDLPALGESFLGGAVGGAVMGGAGVVDTILHTDAKSVRECGDKVRQALSKANKEVSQKVHEAGVEMPELPKQIDWKKSTVPEMKEYFNKVVKVYRDILSDEKVINYDRKVAENTLNKMNTAETGNEVNEATNINNVNATPQTENSIQNVPKTSEIEPLQAVQETAPLNAQVNDISNINTQNSKINADNSTINDTTSEINSVDTLNAIDTLPNISTQENGVQSSVNRVTEEVHNAMKKIGLNVSENATGIQEANTKFMSSDNNLFDRNYVSNYANDFVQAMSEKSGRSYIALSQETDNLADELVNKALTGNSVLDGNREFQTVVRNFKDVLREGIKKNTNLHNNVYGANEVLNAQVQDVENGDYSSLNISENANNNIKFAPVSENGQNVGYVIEQGIDYTNQLSETSFAVKQKNGEYETKQGVTYGRFGTHQSSNGSYIVSYLPTGNATAIFPNQDTAIEFMKQVENETSGYSIYLHNDNDGITKTGGEISQFINALNTIKSNLQVKENSAKEMVSANPLAAPVENATQKDNSTIEIPKSDIKTNETLPVGQLLEDYNDTVDNILSVSDETAKELADNRVAVEILKNTPNVILDNVKGARDLKVIINYTKLYLAVRKNGVFEGHYHNLGAEIAKKLPDFLQNPDAIIQLANGKLNLFTTVKTKKGNNGIISVELNSTKDIGGKYKDYNVVVTMFSSNDNYTKNLISGEGVNIKYKKEDLSQVNPQLYKWLAIINDKSSTNNIVSQDSDVVNSSIRRDTENDTLNLKDKCNLTQTKHTKTGEDLWIIGLKERISADEYKKLNAKVKAVGGYYSRYAKTPDGKPIPGFIFKSEPTEEVFDVFNDFFGTTGTLKETDDVQADENIKDSQSTNNNTESDEENVSENNKTVLNSQSENDTIKEIPDLEIGDVIEYDGRQWKVTQTGLNMSFENLDKSDNKQTFSHIGGIENFKQTHDYKVVSKVDNQKNGGKENGISQQGVLDGKSRNDDRGLRTRTDGTNEESGIDGVHTSHSDDSNNGLRQSVGNERNRPDVRDDSEGIYGGTDKRETTSETEGVSDGGRRGRGTVHNGGIDVVQGMGGQPGQLKDNTDDTPDVIETGAKTVKKEKLPSNKNNFVISDDFAEKYDTTPPSAKDNLDAIELLLKLEEEGREATNEEKEILAKYKGWGGIDTRRLPYEQYSRFNRYFDGVQRKNVQDSMNNAFFTPTKVVDAMYNGLKRLGFKGGNVLETSMGIGNFFGRMPVAMTAKSALTGVELETYTARIAQYLYPGATVINKPFQDIAFKNNSYDLVIGNVPFGQNKISYDKKKYSMHNYFIISSLDKVREGGIVAVITSSGTLDSYGIDARKAIMDRADVVACYKLPEGVFSRSANTGVQSDLLILQKRASGQRPSDDSILNVTTTDDGLRINEYFKKHSENILGALAKGTNAWGEITTVIGDGNFYEKLNDAMSKLPKGLMNGKSELKKVETLVSWSEKPKFFEKGGRIYEDDGAGTATALKGAKENTARDYIAVRDVYKELLEAYEKELPDDDIEILRKKLSEVYDNFYKKHGPITGDGKKKIGKKKSTNNSFLKADSDFYLVGGLERYDKAKKEFAKSVLFEKDTLRKKKITKVDTASDALVVSINETGKVDFKHMQELTGKTEKQIADELKGEIVLTPQGDYVLTDIYLSGNIYEKLDEVKGKPNFEEQEKMLEQVLPKPKNASEIIVKLGANYIDPKYIESFALDTFGQRLNIEKDSSGKWKIDGAGQRRYGEIVNTKYGCKAFNAVQLLEKVLNDGEILAKTKSVVDGKEVVTIDTKMTEVAKQKAEDIKNVFNSWIFRDSKRRNVIVDKYNRMYNNYRPLNYKNIAEKLSFDSMSEELKEKLYPHQKNGIARFLFGGNTLFAHGVGTGKTFEMIASVMEAKRMGIINKTAMVVPNNKVVDFRNDIAEAYPTAKVLVIDTAKAKRQSMLGLVNSNDWDIVLIARTTFTKIPVSKQLEANFISQQLEECNIQIAEAESNRDGSTRAYKNLIKKRNNLEDKLKNLNADTKRDENGIEFEKLGFDAICVDEAHNYKSITTPTSLSIKGLANSSSAQQANDMLMKLDYLRSINGKIVFGTGTPITNTVSEIYNMMRMVRPDILEEAGIHSLDEWVNTFAKIENTVELGIDGQIKPKSTQVIRSFVNASEMIGLFRQFADIVFTEDVVKDLPKAKYVDIKIEGTPEHKQIQQQITDTLANTNKKEMLKVYARLMAMADMASVDTRMLSGAETDVNMYKDYSVDELEHENSKINTMCKQVLNEYKNSNNIKGTQIIFCDKGAGSGEVYSFNLHKDIKNKLIERGVPEEEIVIISNQKDAQLEELYEKVNNGDVRVLIGTCQKMAEGLNVQKRVVAIHHPTVTYKPSDWEQSNARGVRSGNINKEVRIYRYLQENTFDSHKWQAQDRKGEMIRAALRGDAISEMEDVGASDDGGESIDAATAMAITSGNPLVKEKIDIDKEVSRLKTLEQGYLNEIYHYQDVVAKNPHLIEEYTDREKGLKNDIALRDKYNENEIIIKDKCYEKQKDANKALSEAIKSAPKNGKYNAIGSYNGFKIKFKGNTGGMDYSLVIQGENTYTVEYAGGANNIARIAGVLKRLDSDLSNTQNSITKFKSDLEFAKQEANKPFEKETELKEALAKQKDITYKYEHYNETSANQKAENTSETSEKIVNKTDTSSDIQYSKQANTVDTWTSNELQNSKKQKNKKLGDIVSYISKEFNIPISKGNLSLTRAKGEFKKLSKAVRLRIANDLPTATHELGHLLDDEYDFTSSANIDEIIDFAQRKSPTLMKQYKKSEVPDEAVAEFVREFVKDPQSTIKEVPKFSKEFIETLSPKDAQALKTLSEYSQQYYNSDFMDKVDAAMTSNKEIKKKNKPTASEISKEIYTKLVDSFAPIKEATDYVKEVKGTLSGRKDAYILAINSKNVDATMSTIFKEGMVDPNGNFTGGKCLIDCIKDISHKDIDLFDKYLVLKHSLEWIEPQEGAKLKRVFSDDTLQNSERIKREIANLENNHPEFKEASENLYKFQQDMLKYWVVSMGGMDAITYNKLQKMYPHYVPFMRDTGRNRTGFKSGFANQQSPVKTAKGSGATIISPLESIIKNVEKQVKFGTRNRVMAVLGMYADNVPGFANFIEPVPPDQVKNIINIEKLSDEFLGRMSESLDENDLFNLTEAFEDVFGTQVESYTPVVIPGKQIVTYLNKGKHKYYQVHDKALFNAITNLTPIQTGKIMNFAGRTLGITNALITQLNPVFATTNAIRDYDTAMKNSKAYNNPITFTGAYMSALWDVIRNSDNYKQYKAAGGGHMSMFSDNIDVLKKTLREVNSKDAGLARRLAQAIFLHPIECVTKINEITEAIPRLAEFKGMKKKGADNQQAIYAASDITVNFNRSGDVGRKLNKIFRFSNATVQGMDKQARIFTSGGKKEIAKHMLRYLISAILTTALLEFWNRTSDEDGWEELSQYQKNNFYCISIGNGKFIKIPKAREAAILNTTAERAADYAFGDKEAFYQFGQYIGDTTLPAWLPVTGIAEGGIEEGVHQAAGGTILGGIVDNMVNKDFKGTPIVSSALEDEPNKEQYNQKTSLLAKSIGQTFNWSPMKIDHLIDNYTGIIGKLNRSVTADGFSPSNLYGTSFSADSVYSTDVFNRVYEQRDKMQKKYQNEPTPQNACLYEKYATKAAYITQANKAIKRLSEDEQRTARKELITDIKATGSAITDTDKGIVNSFSNGLLTSDNGYVDSLPKSTITKTKNKQSYTWEMTYLEYKKYYDDYRKEVEKQRKKLLNTSAYKRASDIEKTEMLKQLSKDVLKDTKEKYKNRNALKFKKDE
nr:MAG TPA: Type I restriction enzyme Methylase [Caudoviricetes sp.]